MVCANKKRPRERGMWLNKSGAQWEGWCWIANGEQFGCELGIVYCWRIVDGRVKEPRCMCVGGGRGIECGIAVACGRGEG